MHTIQKELQQSDDQTANLLWTGGFDSTFRLLQLLYIERKKVQPIYIIDVSYKSPVYELMAMDDIRRQLNHTEGIRNLLKPTIYIDRSAIRKDEKISKAWKNIRAKRHIGKQYLWFASLCKQYNLKGIQLSAEKPGREERLLDSLAYHLDESRITADYETIFKYFSLPLIHLTKKKMRRIAERENWQDILELTWFCHHPIYHPFKKGIPCGVCNPCRIRAEGGGGQSIPVVLRYGGKYLKKLYNSPFTKRIKKMQE